VSAAAARPKDSERLRVGVVLERCRTGNPWQEYAWRAVAIVPGAPEIAAPKLLAEGDGWQRYHVATLDIELYRSETEGYRVNLSQAEPVVYALWRMDEADPAAWPDVFQVTVCAFEAQDYLDGVDVTVEGMSMPQVVALWLARYVERHHVEASFEKRARKPHSANKPPSAVEEDELG
jgi:hypothetical protein